MSRAVKVPALHALALFRAGNIPLVALTILLLAVALAALAALEVLQTVLVDLVLEGLDVPLQDVPDGLLSLLRVIVVVIAD